MKLIKIIAKWSLLFWLTVGLVFGVLWLLNSPAEFGENSQSNSILGQSRFEIDKAELEIIDASRATPAMGKFKGDDKRKLGGTIWFPEGDSSGHPLIIYSHGFGGYHNESRHLTEYLAANGYIVAAVNFPLSNRRSPAGIPQLLDVVNQPEDVSALIDHVLALNSDPSSPFYGRVDPRKIGAMGLSLGGLTTALVSFHPKLRDNRIQAAVMMAPPLEAFSDRFFASNPTVSSLLLSGSMDRVVPESANATQVKARHPNGWFMSLDKGTHLGFANVGNPLRWMDNPDDLGCAFMNFMLPRLDLPDRWDAVIPNDGGILRDIEVSPPCPALAGKSMNGLKQQWLTRIAVGSFFDMQLRSGDRAAAAKKVFTQTLTAENPALTLASPF
jgi:dienelactone hydrolase